jgi:hypothetical protein
MRRANVDAKTIAVVVQKIEAADGNHRSARRTSSHSISAP